MSGPPLIIRGAAPGDYERIIGEVDRWWGGRSMALMLPRLFFEHLGPWTYVAEQNGPPIGFLAAFRSQTNDRVAYCHFIGVSPDARGQGVGEALYARLCADALAAGCSEVHAVTSPANSGSIAFHRRLGFEPMPGADDAEGTPFTSDYDGPGEHRVRFRKQLHDGGAARAAREAIEAG